MTTTASGGITLGQCTNARLFQLLYNQRKKGEIRQIYSENIKWLRQYIVTGGSGDYILSLHNVCACRKK